MTPSLAVAASFRDEVNALPGFLEMATRFFDEILLVDASMDMTPSSDGSLDIIRKWGISDPPLWDLSNGFGAIRGQLLNSVKSSWCMVLDIDERVLPILPVMHCHGDERYPAQLKPNLTVTQTGALFNHRAFLMERIDDADRHGMKAVKFSRRHWFSPSLKEPCENWDTIHDWQLRCMKTNCGMGYRTRPRMHESAWDFVENCPPRYVDDTHLYGPYIEHLHLHFKAMEPEQRQADIRAYDALAKGD